MLINPYKTNLGLHMNTKNLEFTLSEFLIKGSDTRNLNYEYIIDSDVELIFITGKNDEEQSLPIWNHPLFITDFRGRNKIFIDVRPYVRVGKGSEIMNLSDVISNKLGFFFTIVRVIYMVLLFKDKDSIRNINDSIAVAFSKWISISIKGALRIDIEDMLKLEIVTLHYILCILADEEINENKIENIKFKITRIHKNLKNGMKFIDDVISKININPKNAVDLADNIKNGTDSPLLKNFNTGVLYNIIGSTWNGVNSSENIAMSMEHIPTLIAIISSSLESKALKHSRISNILNDNKRVIGNENLIKVINNTIKENNINLSTESYYDKPIPLFENM